MHSLILTRFCLQAIKSGVVTSVFVEIRGGREESKRGSGLSPRQPLLVGSVYLSGIVTPHISAAALFLDTSPQPEKGGSGKKKKKKKTL